MTSDHRLQTAAQTQTRRPFGSTWEFGIFLFLQSVVCSLKSLVYRLLSIVYGLKKTPRQLTQRSKTFFGWRVERTGARNA